MQMIPIFLYLIEILSIAIWQTIEGNIKNWGAIHIFLSIYWIVLNYKMMRTINDDNILETIFKSSLSLENIELNSS